MNYALHMIAVTQARGIGPGMAYLDKQTGRGKDRVAGLRLLRRRLSGVVFSSLRADDTTQSGHHRDRQLVELRAAA